MLGLVLVLELVVQLAMLLETILVLECDVCMCLLWWYHTKWARSATFILPNSRCAGDDNDDAYIMMVNRSTNDDDMAALISGLVNRIGLQLLLINHHTVTSLLLALLILCKHWMSLNSTIIDAYSFKKYIRHPRKTNTTVVIILPPCRRNQILIRWHQ